MGTKEATYEMGTGKRGGKFRVYERTAQHEVDRLVGRKQTVSICLLKRVVKVELAGRNLVAHQRNGRDFIVPFATKAAARRGLDAMVTAMAGLAQLEGQPDS